MKSKGLITALLLVTVVLNVLLFIVRSSWWSNENNLPPFAVKLDGERQKLLHAWHSANVLPADDTAAIRGQLVSSNVESCFVIPTGFEAVDRSTVPNETRQLLFEFIGELVHAYSTNDPEVILRVMRQYGQEVSPLMREKAMKHFRDRKAAADADEQGIDVGKAWCFYWKDWKYDPRWLALVPSATSVQYYQVDSQGLATLNAKATIASSRHKIWRNQVSIGRHFAPSDGYDYSDAIEDDEKVIFCDIRLVIEHNRKSYGQRSPYFIRLWYNTKTKNWMPVGMTRAKIDMSRSDGVKIAF